MEQTLRATGQKGVHAIFDPVGGDMRKQSLDVLSPLGHLIIVGNASALGMLARKEIHAEIQGVYPLENAADALLQLEERNTVGKLVLRI